MSAFLIYISDLYTGIACFVALGYVDVAEVQDIVAISIIIVTILIFDKYISGYGFINISSYLLRRLRHRAQCADEWCLREF